ncbi:MAG: GNAT family N-acetyltransferase [Haliea sp.]|nr:GNAT family N-acetyltransferase [Haliea sp.]|tara:strand:- start:2217 stop:2768 length:552 start_codon:yes stop_codon:yes gene_type:complete
MPPGRQAPRTSLSRAPGEGTLTGHEQNAGDLPCKLRPESPDDRDLLITLYVDSRWQELAALPWDEAQKTAFLGQQCRAQEAHYRQAYPTAVREIIEVEGTAAGRLCWQAGSDENRVIDLRLLATYRGRGIGSALLRTLQARSQQQAVPLCLSVACDNPARQLYERLGFVVSADDGLYCQMEYR